MPTCTTPPAPIAQEISSRFASSALEAPRRNDVPILSSTFSSQCHPVVVHHWHNVSSHMEIHGLGPPRSDLGYPRDIYIDTSPGNHDVYAHVGDSWRKWGGPANYSVSIIPHPLRPDLYFWCTSSTGPTWNSIDEEPPPVERSPCFHFQVYAHSN
ncbi:hypothetical protein FPV67DRAFT_1490359 [Lyophyllum atratum]|nr:hypothetical protein FPV67DRAFT_1490359 [Lyophyllum atratum]